MKHLNKYVTDCIFCEVSSQYIFYAPLRVKLNPVPKTDDIY